MGMDVSGLNPTSARGEYFRNNVWNWHPLATYCQEVAPEECEACEYWHSNDGAGLDEDGALALAAALEEEVDSGRCADYERRYREEIAALHSEDCGVCGGTGDRPGSVYYLGPGGERVAVSQSSLGMAGDEGVPLAEVMERVGLKRCLKDDGAGRHNGCNGCGGTGKVKNAQAWYSFSVENVRDWIEFLKACGGFEIH